MSLAVNLPGVRDVARCLHLREALAGLKAFAGATRRFIEAVNSTDVRGEMLQLSHQLRLQDPVSSQRLRTAAFKGWME